MNINSAAMRNLYLKKAQTVTTGDKAAAKYKAVASMAPGAPKSENVDTISISSQGVSRSEVAKMTASVVRDVQRFDTSARAEEIARQVSEGTYRVSADQLAEAILGRAQGEA